MAEPAMTIDQALRKAKTLSLQGKVGEAAGLYQAVLKHQPQNSAALEGVRALAARVTQKQAPSSSVDVPQDALQALVSLHGAGQYEAGLQQAQALAALYPASPVLANIQGVFALNLGCKEEAVGHLRRALELQPDFVEVLANLGTLLTEMDRLQEALPYLERALVLRPDVAEIVTSLANVQSGIGLKEQAADSYRKAIRLNPAFAFAHSNLGNLLGQMGKTEEAIASFNEAIRLKPDFADAYGNLGTVLKSVGRLEDAESAYRNALLIEPENVTALVSFANLLGELGRTGEALDCYQKVWRLDPDNLAARALGLYQQALACRWDDAREKSLQFLHHARLTPTGRGAASPFAILTLFDDPILQRRAAANFLAREATGIEVSAAFAPPSTNGRIRIGYFSADFHEHATMYLMARLFELHDKSRFEIHAFSYGPNEQDAMRTRLIRNVEHFDDIRHLRNDEAAALSRSLGIDIAVDLKGFTRDSRTQIFAHRAAPVQVNYLGYPGSCGSAIWDYVIADERIAPEGSEADYAEKLVLLPDSYQVNDDTKTMSQRTFTRFECGLPETGFVFCCFNNSYKITPAEFDIWMRLLKAVEGSVLWLLKGTGETEDNLRREAVIRGVDGGRLVFADRLPVPDHLARHAHADLFLDTFVVNAHTTASDALWAGLPVLVKAGRSFVSRVSASLVHAAGLPELITEDEVDYEALALSLARDPVRLERMKKHLTKAPSSLPLFDTARYTRNLERAFEEMVRISHAGERPRKISLD